MGSRGHFGFHSILGPSVRSSVFYLVCLMQTFGPGRHVWSLQGPYFISSHKKENLILKIMRAKEIGSERQIHLFALWQMYSNLFINSVVPRVGKGVSVECCPHISSCVGTGTERLCPPTYPRQGHAFWKMMQTGSCSKWSGMEAFLKFLQRKEFAMEVGLNKRVKTIGMRVWSPRMLWEFIRWRDFSVSSPALRERHECWSQSQARLNPFVPAAQ